MSINNLNQLSENLLFAVKMKQETQELCKTLANLPPSQFQNDLINDKLKKAFWINIYNSFFQILRKVNQIEIPKIFTQKLIVIANTQWSLDDIEHGILRKFRFKYSLGYFPALFVSKKLKSNAVSEIDYRIHFALNCGAKSCPPIAFYTRDDIEQQLELATQSFLEKETEYNEELKKMYVSRVFFWFLADFGGKKGIRIILGERLNVNFKGYKIVFKDWSWDEHLGNFNDPDS